MSSFRRDLVRGEEIELKHLEKIKEKYPDTRKIYGYCKDYDLYCPSTNTGYEVKYDPMSLKTGNIVIEIEMPVGTPSGLSTTKASIWIIDTGRESFYIKVTDLKELVKKFKPVIFTGKGDRTAKKAYLIKVEYIRSA